LFNPLFPFVFLQGVRQRLNRLEHMKQLSEELAITATDDVEEEVSSHATFTFCVYLVF